MNVRLEGFCEKGLKREENQDAVFFDAEDGRVLALIADGMGGHEDGAKASGLAADSVRNWWRQYPCRSEKPGFWCALQELESVLESVHEELSRTAEADRLSGTTAVLFWAEAGEWAVLSAGDSRCYRSGSGLFPERAVQLTTDDVWENQPEVIRNYSESQIRENVNFGRLVRAVGGRGRFTCSVRRGYCRPGMAFALCSDGVYRYCGKKAWNRAWRLLCNKGETRTAIDLKLTVAEAYIGRRSK